MDSAARSKRSSWSPSVSQDAKENQAGVGILFVEEEDPSGFVRVTVKALIEGGSAEKTGLVKAGDMVVRVGNQDVIGKPLSILRTMIPGPIGSYCKLGFLRGGVALNSNAVQEKSTYYDVQLIRQPSKSEKKKLVSGDASAADTLNAENSVDPKQIVAANRTMLANSTTNASTVVRDSSGQWTSVNVKNAPPVLWTNEIDQSNRPKTWSPQAQPPISGSPPSSTKQRERTDPTTGLMSPNSSALSSAVEAAMSNVDKALYDMQNREIERLKNKLETSEKEIQRLKDELSKEELRRKDVEERYQALEKKSRLASSYPGTYPPNPGTFDQRSEIGVLQQQLETAKQEKQIETYKRIEMENNYKVMERNLAALQSAQKEGTVDARTLQLEQRLAASEEKRREEEKKRAILEGKVRHLENVAKQQSPFRFQNPMKGRKGPPPHMPDIAEGREENIPANHPNGPPGLSRSPTLAAIDGPVPAALAKWGNEGVYIQMSGMQPGIMGVQQAGLPDLYSSQNGMPVMANNAYPSLNAKMAQMHNPQQPQTLQGHSMAMRNGTQPGMPPQQRAQAMTQMTLQAQQAGLPQSATVPQVAYKPNAAYNKMNTPRPVLQGMQMQQMQQQPDNLKSPTSQQAQRGQGGLMAADGQFYMATNGLTAQQQMHLWQQQQQGAANFSQQMHR